MSEVMQVDPSTMNEFLQYYPTVSAHLRYGQAFHNFMNLSKSESLRDWADKLYNMSDEAAAACVRRDVRVE